MRIDEELTALEDRGLLRELTALPATGGKLVLEGREVLNLSSNDYLNLSTDPRVKAAAVRAVENIGCGATASRLMTGHLQLHEELEGDLAALTGREASLVFGSGFLTNLGVVTALVGRGDEIFSDRLNHASLIDGSRLSGAKIHRYRHGDMNHLEDLLSRSEGTGRRLIITDSVFSMDGDFAPLRDLQYLAENHDALLVVDEAHAIGIFGEGGGVCRSLLPDVKPDVVVGTLSKALGGYGGFVSCSSRMKEYLINRARSFIFSTALPPACLAGARAAVRIINETPALGDELLARSRFLSDSLIGEGLLSRGVESHILPFPVGDDRKALALSRELLRRGLIAKAIRPPTVPVDTARLRLSVTLAHSRNDLTKAVEMIAESVKTVGML